MTDTEPMFSKRLQAGILKPHGRDHTCYVLLRLNEDVRKIGLLLQVLKDHVDSYFDQVDDIRRYKKKKEQALKAANGTAEGLRKTVVKSIAMGAGFYAKSGLREVLDQLDDNFAKGILGQRGKLPFYLDDFSQGYGLSANDDGPFDLMFFYSSDDLSLLQQEVAKLVNAEYFRNALLKRRGVLLEPVIEFGFAEKLKKRSGEGFNRTKPLGYIDGISERRGTEEVAHLTLAEAERLKPGKYEKDANLTFGSYIYFQKIALDESRFMKIRDKIAASFSDPEPNYVAVHYRTAAATGFSEADRKKAEALLMGRFTDGLPITRGYADSETDLEMPLDYRHDTKGEYCPFQAHIRSVNPRVGGFTNGTIVRRGTYFGNYDAESNSVKQVKGLYFVSLQRDIKEQLLPVLAQMKQVESRDPIAYGRNGDLKFIVPARYYSHGKDVEVSIRGDFHISKYIGGDFFYMPSMIALSEYTRHCLAALPIEEIT